MQKESDSSSSVLVALVGNPNSGKTSLFNQLTGANEKVGNYPGVTVEKIESHYIYQETNYHLVDLPGMYSMIAYAPDERITRDFLSKKPSVVVNVVAASNLERSLSFTVQLLEMGLNVVIALNMADELYRSGRKLDIAKMAGRLRVPLVLTVGHRGEGIEELKQTIAKVSQQHPLSSLKICYHAEVEEGIQRLTQVLPKEICAGYSTRYRALQLLESDPELTKFVHELPAVGKNIEACFQDISQHIQTVCGDLPDVVISDGRYGFVAGLLRDATIFYPKIDRVSLSEKIDAVVTHRVLALPIFLGLMYMLFWIVFTMGEWPMQWLEAGFRWLGIWLCQTLSDGMIQSFLVDGIIAGVGGVIVFLPNILLLFLGIAILEDTGYMARAAFIMDAFMKKLGLQGKSFIPMLIGFGCTVPGMMATQILENRKDRMATMLVLPLMSCGARFTIYALIIPAFFPAAYQALILWLIYLIGILLAAFMARLLRQTILKGGDSPFVMELPPYRMPTWRGILHHGWERSVSYLQKAATVILAISICIWIASYYPRKTEFDVDLRIANGEKITAAEAKQMRVQEQLQHSWLGQLGQTLEPLVAPMGMDGRIATALIGSVAGKEIFVAQLGVTFSVGMEEDQQSLREKLRQQYRPLVALCILLFCLIAMPCIATVSIMAKESGQWSWAMLQFWGLTLLGYVITTIVYQMGAYLGF